MYSLHTVSQVYMHAYKYQAIHEACILIRHRDLHVVPLVENHTLESKSEDNLSVFTAATYAV